MLLRIGLVRVRKCPLRRDVVEDIEQSKTYNSPRPGYALSDLETPIGLVL